MSDETKEAEVQPNAETTETHVEESRVKPRAKRESKVAETEHRPAIRDHEDAILELRRENERLRKSLEDASEEKAQKIAEERIAKAKEEARTDAQKLLDERVAEMEKANRNRLMKAELKAHAQKAGVVDFDDLFAVMTRADTLSKIEFSDDGEVMNAGQIIADLKDSKPHFFGGVSTSSTAQVPAAAARPAKPEKIALKMSHAEYMAARAKLGRIQ